MGRTLNSLAMGAIVCASVAVGAWLGHGRSDDDMANPPMAAGIQRSVDIESKVVVFDGYRQVDGETRAVFRRVSPQEDPADQEFVLSLGSALTRLGHLRNKGIAHEQTLRAVEEWPE